jgi:ABC-type nitrate/sulfonate/bicarbonate transport system permease component
MGGMGEGPAMSTGLRIAMILALMSIVVGDYLVLLGLFD